MSEAAADFRLTPRLSGQERNLCGLPETAQALAAVKIAREEERLVLWVLPNMTAVARVQPALEYFADQSTPVLSLPTWETLPFDIYSPSPNSVGERLETLHRLPLMKTGVATASVEALMQRLPPPSFISLRSLVVRVGDREQTRNPLIERFANNGYLPVSQVSQQGEFAVRGSLIDVWPMGQKNPVRLDFIDEEVCEIQLFDAETQLAAERCDRIHIFPRHEFALENKVLADFKTRLGQLFPQGDGASLIADLERGIRPPGIENYLPLFHPKLVDFREYLPARAAILAAAGIEEAAGLFNDLVTQRCRRQEDLGERPTLPPDLLYLNPRELALNLQDAMTVDEKKEGVDCGVRPLPSQALQGADAVALYIEEFCRGQRGLILIAAASSGRREIIGDALRRRQVPFQIAERWRDLPAATETRVCLTTAAIDGGFALGGKAWGFALISDLALDDSAAPQPEEGLAALAGLASLEQDAFGFDHLLLDAPVIHEKYGIGRYRGLEMIDINGVANEFLHIEYRGGSRLFVPVQDFDLVQPYAGGDGEDAPWHEMGGREWQRAHKRAEKKIQDAAVRLLELYARRSCQQGHSFNVDEEAYMRFASAFPFQETPDQQRAINEVIADMRSARPMDRLICGDVGFGKTEVAMRAAFICALDGLQVAVLTPTTLLAEQHHRTFSDRFSGLPLNLRLLSRVAGQGAARQAIEEIGNGGCDLVIGTHRLLQKGIRFKRLGLLIVDEEHRFGVIHKERIKELRANIDVLSLTATPIPRTLQLSMTGLRDLSLISTPPPRRQRIKTLVQEWDDDLIHEVCQRELLRGGQIFYVHNRISSIGEAAERLAQVVPEASMRLAHGRMAGRELKRIMSDFLHRRFDILVCTTIIESGIDMANVNTILIDRPDRLGLAELHQLRGRVGRSNHVAYALLLTPPPSILNRNALKRLEAIASYGDLGIGLHLAIQDLEIRGAGELLGEGQSGHLENIGLQSFQRLLKRAIAETRRQKGAPAPEEEPDIDFGLSAMLPHTYIQDAALRLKLYKQLASCEDDSALERVREEIENRFGPSPAPARNLFATMQARRRCRFLGVSRLRAHAKGGLLEFSQTTSLAPAKVIELLQEDPPLYRFDRHQTLRFSLDLKDNLQRLDFVFRLLDRLAA